MILALYSPMTGTGPPEDVAVCNTYKYQTGEKPAISRDYENTRQVAEAIYGHSRLSLPYNLVLIGY